MGLTIAKLLTQLFSKQEMKIIMIGLDGAGKTTILYKLKLGEVVTTIPTIGFNVETVEYNNITFTVWDAGGQEKIRAMWAPYFQNMNGIIFVIDSNDQERLGEAIDELGRILKQVSQNAMLQAGAVLVFANKQDLPNALSPSNIQDEIAKKIPTSNIKVRVQKTVALSGEGLEDGLRWLSSVLS